MKLYLLLLLPFWLSGASLSALIENAKNSHISLRAIEQKLNALDDEYDATRNFSNPELSLSVSDIQFNDPTNRRIEPMQFSSINFKQKIPYFGKRDANSRIIEAQKHKLGITLEDAKVKLIKEIKLTAYSIWQAEQQLRINSDYITLTEQNIELYTAYSSSDTSAHMGIMSTELSLSQLNIKKSRLKTVLEALYKKISYLSAMDVTTVSVDMKIEEPKDIDYYLKTVSSNPSYRDKEASVEIANADLKVKELASSVDTTLQVGYYHREKFENYMSVGVGFSLPLYGTEKSKTEASRKTALAKESEALDYKNSISSKVFDMYAQLKDSYAVYNIINKESLPQIEHMADLSSTSVKNGADLFVYTQMLEKKLILQEQSINAIVSYNSATASLEALIGENK
jgi:outer membrane protein TolC